MASCLCVGLGLLLGCVPLFSFTVYVLGSDTNAGHGRDMGDLPLKE